MMDHNNSKCTIYVYHVNNDEFSNENADQNNTLVIQMASWFRNSLSE